MGLWQRDDAASSKTRSDASSRFRIRVWAVVLWIMLWQAAAMLMDSALLLPGPVDVLARFFALAGTAEFWGRVGFTLLRIVAGFVIGVVLGAVLAAIAMRFHRAGELFAPAMALAKSVPVACFVVLALIWAGASQLSVIVGVLVVAPIVYENVCVGVRATDVRLLEMAQVLRVPAARTFTAIYLPQVLPYFRAACASSFGMAWKAGVAAEIIAIPAGSMGEALYGAKIYFDTPDLFAWTLAVVVLSVLFEKAFAWVLDAVAARGMGADSASKGVSSLEHGSVCPESAFDDVRVRAQADVASRGSRDVDRIHALACTPGDSGASRLDRIEFNGVGKSFDSVSAFSDISFTVEGDAPVCLMAPSGFGKTTLLRMAACVENPDEGSVKALDVDGSVFAPRISMAFQEDRLIEHLDALANARIALHARDAVWDDAPRLLERLGIGDCIGKPARSCSGGQRRRIVLARALLTPHDALLLDEPFTGLDDASRTRAARIVRAHERGRVVIVATHDGRDAALLGARVVRLDSDERVDDAARSEGGDRDVQ